MQRTLEQRPRAEEPRLRHRPRPTPPASPGDRHPRPAQRWRHCRMRRPPAACATCRTMGFAAQPWQVPKWPFQLLSKRALGRGELAGLGRTNSANCQPTAAAVLLSASQRAYSTRCLRLGADDDDRPKRLSAGPAGLVKKTAGAFLERESERADEHFARLLRRQRDRDASQPLALAPRALQPA